MSLYITGVTTPAIDDALDAARQRVDDVQVRPDYANGNGTLVKDRAKKKPAQPGFISDRRAISIACSRSSRVWSPSCASIFAFAAES